MRYDESCALVSQNIHLEENGDEDHKERDKCGHTVSACERVSAGKVPKVADSACAADNNVADHIGYGHIGDAVAQS